MVPAVAADVVPLGHNPVIAYMHDGFQKPYPFQPEVVIDVGPVFRQIVTMLDCHASQFYDWLPFVQGRTSEVPQDPELRREWLGRTVAERLRHIAQIYGPLLIQTYGAIRGREIEFAEAFEVCEYGSRLDAQARQRLFPFLPPVTSGIP
jgi:hypothetical protein